MLNDHPHHLPTEATSVSRIKLYTLGKPVAAKKLSRRSLANSVSLSSVALISVHSADDSDGFWQCESDNAFLQRGCATSDCGQQPLVPKGLIGSFLRWLFRSQPINVESRGLR